MVKHESFPIPAEQKARETLDKMAHAMAEALAAVEPENSGVSPLEVFPEPGQRRADTEFDLPAQQESSFRQAMAKLGIGRETNLGATEVGLRPDFVAIIEGGQAHKMVAEINLILADQSTRPSEIIVAATPHRTIPPHEEDKAKEREVTAKVLSIGRDEVGENEYQVAEQIARSIPGFIAGPPQNTLKAGYTLEGEITDEQTGHFTRLGQVGDINVTLMRIDRKYSEGGQYKTLGSKGLMKVVSHFLTRQGFDNDIGFVTSATYQPSREVDAASTMLEVEREGTSRNIGVLTYGTHELAAAKKEQYPAQPSLGQLAGEAHKATRQIMLLRELLQANSEEA